MKKTRIINKLVLLSLVIFSLFISGCSHKDKEVVITKNVRAEAKQGKNQVKKYIEIGNDLLEKSKYDDAKSAYEKAIRFDKMNKDTYLTIENKYIEKNRIQDAADIIQEAVNNDVDVSDMKKILLVLKQKIEIASEETENSKKNEDSLHQQKTIIKSVQKQDNESQEDNQSAEQDNLEATKLFVIIQNLYEHNGKKYVSVIPGEYFEQSQAVQEAAKDGVKIDTNYYIRKIGGVEDIEVSNNAKFIVDKFIVDNSYKGNSTEAVSYEQFKNLENNYIDTGYFWIYINRHNRILRFQTQIIT